MGSATGQEGNVWRIWFLRLLINSNHISLHLKEQAQVSKRYNNKPLSPKDNNKPWKYTEMEGLAIMGTIENITWVNEKEEWVYK